MEPADIRLSFDFSKTQHLCQKQDPYVLQFIQWIREVFSPLDQMIRGSDLDQLFKQLRPYWKTLEDFESLFDHYFEPEIRRIAHLLEKHRKGNQQFLMRMNGLKPKEKRDQLLLSYLISFSKIEIFHFPKKIKKLPPFFDLDAVQEIFLTFRLEYSIRLEMLIALSTACLKKASIEKQQRFQKILLGEFQKRKRLQTQQACLIAMLRLNSPIIPLWTEFLSKYNFSSTDKPAWLNAYIFELWAIVNPALAIQEMKHQIFEEKGPDHFFLRQALIKQLEKMQQSEILFQKLNASDSSELVLFQLIDSLLSSHSEVVKALISQPDISEKVKSYALVQWCRTYPNRAGTLLQKQCSVIEKMNPLSRIILEESEVWLHRFYPQHPDSTLLLQYVLSLTQVSVPPLQNKAFELYESVVQKSLSGYAWFKTELSPRIEHFRSKQKGILLKQDCPLSAEDLGRLLTTHCARSFPLEIQETRKKWIFYSGSQKQFALWRMFYEFKHPSPEKRRTTSHLHGKMARGTLRIPSQILSELSRTKVPGEPTYVEEIEGWAPHLPTVDDCLSLFRFRLRGKQVAIFTFRGITRLEGPRKKKWRLFLKMSWNYSKLDQLRRYACLSQEELKKFQAVLWQDYQIRFWEEAYPTPAEKWKTQEEVKVPMFFFLFWFSFDWHWENFFSLYPDFLHKTHLGLFLFLFILLFLVKSFFRTQQFRRARAKIPLVIGGWGTRGKSGTERLKAAMFHEMGYRVFSKTTGCDAMFLHNGPLPYLQEMYLFRPYEKASIWEQRDCTLMAEKLNVDIFLWECMALNPLYAQFLQESWMQDHFSTMTNTYPDHEDIQGPSGIDVAQSLTHFVPKHATLVTTEEQMLPILEQTARLKKSQVASVSWRESYFIPQEVLQRLPYQEHPLNIALVTRLGSLLGLSKERIWKGFGDFLIADLGALKIFGPITYRDRQLRFINGMSANERLGSIGNWKRCQLDRHHPLKDRASWVVTVVNNRADRIARSKVFARMLVEEVFACRHFLIGTNLSGFKNYVEQAFEEVYADWRVPFSTQEEFHRWLCQYKYPYFEESEVQLFFQQMLSPYQSEEEIKTLFASFGSLFLLETIHATHTFFDPEVKTKHVEEISLRFQPLRKALQEKISPELLQEIFEFLKEAVLLHRTFRKFWSEWEQKPDLKKAKQLLHQMLVYSHHYLENATASGDMLIELLTQQTPPGFQITIMGLQNIKQKTSMEFVHSWISSETLAKRFQHLEKQSEEEIQLFLLQLQSYPEWNVFTCEIAQQQMLQKQPIIPAHLQESWEEMRLHIQKIQQERRTHSSHQERQGVFDLFQVFLEKLLDMTDAKRRRRFSGKLYQELIKRRISHRKVALFVQQLMQRQKGGWLKENLKTQED